MFLRLRSAIFREPKVILPKLCVCYVISAEYLKVGSGYRLVMSVVREWITVWCCQSVGSGYRLVMSVGREWITVWCCQSVGSGYRLVLLVGRAWITVWCCQSVGSGSPSGAVSQRSNILLLKMHFVGFSFNILRKS
jgi:hypothetical protein